LKKKETLVKDKQKETRGLTRRNNRGKRGALNGGKSQRKAGSCVIKWKVETGVISRCKVEQGKKERVYPEGTGRRRRGGEKKRVGTDGKEQGQRRVCRGWGNVEEGNKEKKLEW